MSGRLKSPKYRILIIGHKSNEQNTAGGVDFKNPFFWCVWHIEIEKKDVKQAMAAFALGKK